MGIFVVFFVLRHLRWFSSCNILVNLEITGFQDSSITVYFQVSKWNISRDIQRWVFLSNGKSTVIFYTQTFHLKSLETYCNPNKNPDSLDGINFKPINFDFQPESEEWKLFVDTPEVQVFAWLDPETGYFQWKVFGEIEYSQEILKKVLLDIDYRKTWDSYVGSIEKIEENNNLEIIYWDVKYGVPFVSNRDYVYCRELKGKNPKTRMVYLEASILANVFQNSPVYV